MPPPQPKKANMTPITLSHLFLEISQPAIHEVALLTRRFLPRSLYSNWVRVGEMVNQANQRVVAIIFGVGGVIFVLIILADWWYVFLAEGCEEGPHQKVVGRQGSHIHDGVSFREIGGTQRGDHFDEFNES